VTHVRFSPEEMAYDVPADVSDPRRFPVIGRGESVWKRFLSFRNGFVRLDPQLRKAFPDERSVNAVLRRMIQASEGRGRRGKSA
jgi:hypothetical protein